MSARPQSVPGSTFKIEDRVQGKEGDRHGNVVESATPGAG